MAKSILSLRLVVSIVGFLALSLLAFLSVLGVNNSVHGNMLSYFQNVSANDYTKALSFYSHTSPNSQKSFNDSMEFHFALELALLEYFDLLDSENYKIKIERENMWFPLFTKNELNVSVSFQKQDNSSIFPKIINSEEHKKLESFLTVVREDEKWKIKTVNIAGSDLEKIYDELKNSFDADKYVKVTQNGFILKNSEIDLHKLNAIEKRVLVHNLKTALASIESGKKK